MKTFSIDFSELQRFLKLGADKKIVSRAVQKALSAVAIQIRRDSYPNVPRGIGNLINSWKVEKQGELSIEVGFDIVYAMYQHQGMRADGTYIIRNRPAGGKSFYLKEAIDENLQRYFDMYETIIFNELWQ